MKVETVCVFVWLLVLTGASRAEEKESSPGELTLSKGQSDVLPPVFIPATSPGFTGTPAFPAVTEDPGNEAPQGTHNPPGRDETPTDTTTQTQTEETVSSESVTDAVLTTHLFTTSPAATTEAPVAFTDPSDSPTDTAAAGDLSPLPTGLHTTQTTHLAAPLTSTSPASFSSQSDHTVQDASPITPSTTKPESDPFTTGAGRTTSQRQTSRPPAGPQHQDVPSELNVGDDELKTSHHRPRSPLDPLLAGLLSVFIVTTAIVFVVLFLKFKQRTNHPEFHRLQDLPMDDLMEDTPLSRYSY